MPAVAVVAPLRRRLRATAVAHERQEALPALLEDVAGGLRAGGSLRQALAAAASRAGPSLHDEVTDVVSAVERGTPVVAALDSWRAREPGDGVELAVAALALGAEAGGRHARALDAVATTLRDRLAVGQEVRALSSQARASATVLIVAPFHFALLSAAVDGRTAHFLLATLPGMACVGGGVALDAAGLWWMLRLTGAIA
jgi:tight adherence protein B